MTQAPSRDELRESLNLLRKDFETRATKRLELLSAKGRHRELRPRSGLDFSSNDYLGLTDHPAIRERLIEALGDGVPLGSGGSRLLRGNTEWHDRAEAELAAFKRTEAALIFNSGFEANVGVIATLCGAGDLIFADQLVHASMIDGMRQSKARRVSFRHNDCDHLEQLLREEGSTSGKRFILIESLYSMDGDRAPLADLAWLAARYQAHLIVDEAHATGVFGATGAGLLEEAGLLDVPLICVHTCGKAWGGFGAFVTCSRPIRDLLVNQCRNFIFTTALPPLIPIQLLAALEVIAREPWRRQRVLAAAGRFREGLAGLADMGHSDSQIVPVVMGADRRAVALADRLQAAGFDIRAIRPPTVPPGSARLRVAFNAGHDAVTIEKLVAILREILADPDANL
ncbi:8-amino-7-oxononanoate synthase [Sulfidibacter corallicola]|uniref:8-amino-7-oxononanoate synthase n=1 Tax=Sulfidibacter corallicola TaxID=2818388 RepID=A0A8A4TTP5_SULCO|nr:8-amino-7-oxononanoate synthase [Sulfidibacter corallicola]QTD52853.1 8-amino-7-oxononanoate synthase [Sulfidibacter corallicola]